MAGEGLVVMTPSSIAYSGTSASINSYGGVDFDTVSSVSLNDVFVSAHEMYLLVLDGDATSPAVDVKMRLSGTDSSASYNSQYLLANGTTVSGARTTSATKGELFRLDGNNMGNVAYVYGPAIAEYTTMRTIVSQSTELIQNVCVHAVSTAYDGITLFRSTGSFTGTLSVFGYEE